MDSAVSAQLTFVAYIFDPQQNLSNPALQAVLTICLYVVSTSLQWHRHDRRLDDSLWYSRVIYCWRLLTQCFEWLRSVYS